MKDKPSHPPTFLFLFLTKYTKIVGCQNIRQAWLKREIPAVSSFISKLLANICKKRTPLLWGLRVPIWCFISIPVIYKCEDTSLTAWQIGASMLIKQKRKGPRNINLKELGPDFMAESPGRPLVVSHYWYSCIYISLCWLSSSDGGVVFELGTQFQWKPGLLCLFSRDSPWHHFPSSLLSRQVPWCQLFQFPRSKDTEWALSRGPYSQYLGLFCSQSLRGYKKTIHVARCVSQYPDTFLH